MGLLLTIVDVESRTCIRAKPEIRSPPQMPYVPADFLLNILASAVSCVFKLKVYMGHRAPAGRKEHGKCDLVSHMAKHPDF